MRSGLVAVLLVLVAVSSSRALDNFGLNVRAGAKSVSLSICLRSSANNSEFTGQTPNDVAAASYWRQGSTRTAITTATLANAGSAYASGGFVEVDGTNMPCVYRFDVPDAAFAAGADWVIVQIKPRNAAYNYVERFQIGTATESNVAKWFDTTVATPATAGLPDINVKNINNAAVSTTAAQVGVNVVTGNTKSFTEVGGPATVTSANNLANFAVDATGAAKIQAAVKKNVALSSFMFLATDSTNHNPLATPSAGFTCTRSIDGAAFGAGSLSTGTVSNGIQTVTFAASDLNGSNIVVRCAGTGMDDALFTLITYP